MRFIEMGGARNGSPLPSIRYEVKIRILALKITRPFYHHAEDNASEDYFISKSNVDYSTWRHLLSLLFHIQLQKYGTWWITERAR
jgi:hypothetical protein